MGAMEVREWFASALLAAGEDITPCMPAPAYAIRAEHDHERDVAARAPFRMPRDARNPSISRTRPPFGIQYFAADRLMFDPRVALTRSVRWS